MRGGGRAVMGYDDNVGRLGKGGRVAVGGGREGGGDRGDRVEVSSASSGTRCQSGQRHACSAAVLLDNHAATFKFCRVWNTQES